MLRIVGGALSGRRFAGPRGDRTRPTAERVREAMMSALEARDAIRGTRVLDLFAGTGALAFETLSRGAVHAICVDHDRRALDAINAAARDLGLAGEVTTLSLDLLDDAKRSARRLAREGPFGLVLADPPYADAAGAAVLLGVLGEVGALLPDALVVLEHSNKSTPDFGAGLATVASYRYGDTAVTFAREEAPPE